MPDGCRLAARIWLPEDAVQHPVPAILEYIPYRKNDFTAERDARMHPYFAGHGYAAVRVDLRGSGDSQGILLDEYLAQEQDDALTVLAWIAAQPWCTGAVGIMGISWGGFNALQVAARQPPELKAVISIASTDDRYADDVHYMGGCVLGIEVLEWASTMLAFNGAPPDPEHVGAGWREQWLQRLELTPTFIEAWLSHQRRDDYWKHGSVCEDYAAITCPVYAVGGWADAYTNAVLRLLQGLPGIRKGLIGPWAHSFPHDGAPGPAIGFLQECLRWWDHWLKGMDTGILDEPMLRVWLRDSLPPTHSQTMWPGRWAAEPAWPSAEITPHTYWLNAQGLERIPRTEEQVAFRGAQEAGMYAGVWCPYGIPGDLPPDQRLEDGLSLAFTSEPANTPVEILGFPEVMLEIAVDRPLALLAVRLCDVAPTGASSLVTRGLLNLTHRHSHEEPTPLEPGKRYTVAIRLNAIGYALPAGHRWRVAISPTYWPHAWPSPEPVTLTLFTGEGSRLALPVRPVRAEDGQLSDFGPAEGSPPLQTETVRSARRSFEVRQDLARGRYQIIDHSDAGATLLIDNGILCGSGSTDVYTIFADQPLSAHVESRRTVEVGRGEWQTRVETSSTMSSDAQNFFVTNLLDAYEGNIRIFTRTWNLTIPRDLV